METPIAVMSFDREEYLSKFCESLLEQREVKINHGNIYLMQDGSRSKRSGVVYADQAKLDACVSTFLKYFPNGKVVRSEYNLGIALNFERAERFMFENLNAKVAYFFEDDLVLGPFYLAIMEKIKAQINGRKVGYFACYGDFKREADGLVPSFIPLEHHWGFGLTQSCWREMQAWLKPFYDIYRVCDYRWRPHIKLLECFTEKTVAWGETSQDVAKTAACAALGFARINTDACYAKYIGAKGQSFNEKKFADLGFANASMVDLNPKTVRVPDEAGLTAIATEKRHAMEHFRREQLANVIRERASRLFDPYRMATRDDIDTLWKVIMDRLPEKEYYDAHIGKTPFLNLRSNLIMSNEARGKSFYGSLK